MRLPHLLPLTWTVVVLTLTGAKVVNITVDDASGQITFSPPPNTNSVWSTEDSIHSYNNTLTLTGDANALVTFQFNGTAVYLVGSDWKFGRPFMANIDGKLVAGGVTGTNLKFEVQSTPYWGLADLEMTTHLLNILTWEADNGTTFAVDALIYTTDDSNSSNSSNSSIPTNSTNPISSTTSTSSLPVADAASASKFSTTAILGGTIGGAGALILALLLSIKFKINIVGNLHLGTWRPFSGEKAKARFAPLDIETGSYSSSNEKAKVYSRHEDADPGFDDYGYAAASDKGDEEDGGDDGEDGDGSEDEDVDDDDSENEDAQPARRSSNAPEFTLLAIPASRGRTPALRPQSGGFRPPTPSRMSPQVATARPRRTKGGRASPAARPIGRAGQTSRPSSPSSASASGQGSRASGSSAGSNLRYSMHEDDPLMSTGGRGANPKSSNGRGQINGMR